MALLFTSGYADLLVVLLALVICFVTFMKWSFTYWNKKNVPYLEPVIPWGTLKNLYINRVSFGEVILSQYKEAKQKEYKWVGLYGFSTPMFMVLDPLIIKHILSADFKYFINRGVYYNEKDDPLSCQLFSIEGLKWKNLRNKITPTFTTGKQKMMFSIFTECGAQMNEAMQTISATKKPVDINNILGRFTTNVIGSAAFGIECNSFTDDESDFQKYGKKVFRTSTLQAVKSMIAFINPNLARFFGVCITPKDTSDFFMRVITDLVDYREKNNVQCNDFMQMLINLKNGVRLQDDDECSESQYKHDGNSLTFEELAAQAFVFFIAGFETSSTLMTFALFELAINADIQEKLRKEIKEVTRLHGAKLTYEGIFEMKYLGQIIDETLRKYPPAPTVHRSCEEDYRIPNTDIILERGTAVFIPVVGLHNDPEYFPNPEVFDPERFNKENRNNIHPYTYIPFGEGPRICIGKRFGLLQTRVGLAILLQNFKFSLHESTKLPLKMDPKSFIQSSSGIFLNVEEI